MGIFSQVRESKVNGGGLSFSDQHTKEIFAGRYRVKVTAAKTITAQVGGKLYAIIEMAITESTNPARPVGMKPSQVIPVADIMGPPNIKKFINACFGEPGDGDVAAVEAAASELIGRTVSYEQICDFVFSDENPMQDIELVLEIVPIRTKKGDPFPRHDWSAVPAQ